MAHADENLDEFEQAEQDEATQMPIGPHVEELDTRVDELTNDLKRVQAEFVNFRRRADAERGDMMDFAKGQVVRELLTVRDNLDRAMAHKPADLHDHAWAKSFDAIVSDFDAALKRLGVAKFDSLGQEFDPHRHEAVATDGDGSTVIEELQPGYLQGETVLRHAIVRVGSKEK